MNLKLIHRIIGAIVYLFSVTVLFLTVQPSVSFWDCGELSAASAGLQITHPPGAPFFILLNHILSLIPFASNIGFRINSLTVIASAFSVLFCYLVAVKLINNWRGKEQNASEQIITYITSAIGALSLGFANSFWFNSTESNVFGFSTFLYSLMIWLMMVWYEKADQKGSDRYLLLVAFILGLSPGVHLMSVLAGVTLGMIYVFRRVFTDDAHTLLTAKMFLGNVALLLVVALFMWAQNTGSTPPSPEEYRAFDSKFKIIMIIISIVYIGFFYKKGILKRSSFYWAFLVGMIVNFAVYPGLVKNLTTIIETIGGNNLFNNLIIFFVFIAGLAYLSYWAHKSKRFTTYLVSTSVLVAILGFSVYCYIIIRANQRPPMNENDPKDVKTLVSYLSREQYGEFPTFKRRFSAEPQHQPIWQNYSSDLEYFWKWQMNHMYNRYLFWNFIGRESWEQDAGVKFSQLYGIPFIIGLLGLFYHFRRNWKLASIFLVAFIFMGYMICFYQNQQQMQPRDREYFYSGSWFVFALWIAISLRGIIEDLKMYLNPKTAKSVGYAVLVVGFLAIPMNMLRTNYPQEDRSKNWIPWDYAYNMLQSCAPNAILFTCGDNDTFPLWYLQDVEGIRRDVRIANLSLINTDWYIKQLKNDMPYGAQKVAISYTNDQIEKLQPVQWETKNIDIPVPRNVYDELGVKDTNEINKGKITFTMKGTLSYGKVSAIRVQDMMVRDIITMNKWQRPIYFAASCGDDSKIGLDDYLRLEGLAQRLVPKKTDQMENIDTALCNAYLLNLDPAPSKTYQPGFIIRSFNDPSVFLDENQERVTYGYRNSYLALANYYAGVVDNREMALKVLNTLEKKFPRAHTNIDYRLLFNMANIYYRAGDMNTFNDMAKDIEKEALEKIAENPRNISGYYNPYLILKVTYENAGDYDKEIDILNRMMSIAGKSQEIQDEISRISHLKDSLKIKK